MNPYAAALGDRDPLETIAATPIRLRDIVERLGERVEQPRAPGKWSPRQIACHLADCEISWAFRLRQALGEHHHVLQPFDQDAWAGRYAAYSAAAALATLEALRAWNRALIATLSQEDFARQAWHPERGVVSVRELVETMAGHDLHHLAQLEPASRRTG